MPNSIKFNSFENLNLLNSLAQKGNPNFPDDICIFIKNEFDLNNIVICEEDSENNFKSIGHFAKPEEFILPDSISIFDYLEIKSQHSFQNSTIKECKLNLNYETKNLQSIIFNISENKFGLILLFHKVLPSQEYRQSYTVIPRFVQNLLSVWKSSNQNNYRFPLTNNELFFSATKGLQKEIQTINGLLTLAKEENKSNSINKFLDQIKSSQNFLLTSLDDFNELVKMYVDGFQVIDSPINLNDFWVEFISKKNIELPETKIELNNSDSTDIIIDKTIFSRVLNLAINHASDLSQSKDLSIRSNITMTNDLQISIVSKKTKINNNNFDSILDPFGVREFLKTASGISINVLQKGISLLGGTFKLSNLENDLHINISLPIKSTAIKELENLNLMAEKSNLDKILVIESDSASSTLLNSYLSKWHYQTEIVNSGERALKVLQTNKYVAVILNIEQENDNSLELLQKIKNTKSTRNTPVIVFSLEAEKEKIYMMGSVEYLVKPINYNNLIEILTSYKLRRNSTVLCVDDDQPTLSLVKQAVQTAGFNVIAEYRPELVHDLIKGKDLDLAIIDLDMPKMNGFDLIKQIKSDNTFEKLPIIIYTGKEDYQEDLQKIDGLFVDLLDKKSTSFNELENTISAMIKSYEETKPIDQIKEKSDSPTILMAEDYKHSQIIVTRLLKKSGFENVIVVENGEDALNICKKEKIDLILMDMQMPVMNGFEATGKIRELDGYHDTPIIALTAFAMKGDREKCLEAGATDYIPKPIDSKEFIEKVKYYAQVKIEN